MNRRAAALLGLGLLQMSGDVLEQAGLEHVGQTLKALGAATTASPAPRVFSASRGLETYSTRFYLEWTDRVGRSYNVLVTPELYQRLEGPYNRRNAYGAALAYGPVLATTAATKPLFDSVARYALCDPAPVLRELGIDPASAADRVKVRYEALPGTNLGTLPAVLEARCE